MVYCKKCARLLEEDVRFCPYCNEEDETFVPEDETLERLRQIDEQIAQNTRTPEPPVPPLSVTSPTTEGMPIPPIPPIPAAPPITPASPAVNEPAADPIFSGSTRKSPLDTIPSLVGHMPQAAGAPEETPPTGLYVGLIILSIFLTIPGFIIGIVYMTNKNHAYRKMGLVVLLVSIAATLVWVFACCAMFYAVGNSMGDTLIDSYIY